MKRTGIVALFLAASVMAGCGAQPANATPESQETVPAAVSETETAETQAEQEEEGTADSFVFEYEGTEISVNQEMAGVLEALGEPNSYFEAASCAFEGLDKMYTYSSFEIDTYPEGDKDYISCIYFKDDMVQTQEGVSLFMTQADMESAYGTDYEMDNGAFVYTKGNGQLSFIIENDEIVSIEYKTMVDYN